MEPEQIILELDLMFCWFIYTYIIDNKDYNKHKYQNLKTEEYIMIVQIYKLYSIIIGCIYDNCSFNEKSLLVNFSIKKLMVALSNRVNPFLTIIKKYKLAIDDDAIKKFKKISKIRNFKIDSEKINGIKSRLK